VISAVMGTPGSSVILRSLILGGSCFLASLPLFAGEKSALPDPLMPSSAKRIESKEQWEDFLRAETLQLFRENVYGRAPVGKPGGFTVRVVKEVPDALRGLGTCKFLEIGFDTPLGRRTIHPVVILPNDRRNPVPCFLLINNRKPDLLDPNNTNEFFPAEAIIRRGFAAVGFHYEEIDPDRPDGYSKGVRAAFDSGLPKPNAWGSIAAWAWGASRVLDALETEKRIDTGKVALVGHSRGGKTALWAGAEDQRFSMVISNNSGITGAALSRDGVGERIARINRKFPYWLCGNYKTYDHRENELPVDQHQLIALMAPRPVYVASAIEDHPADPPSEFRACVEAGPVFRLYGLPSVTTAEFPEVGTVLHDGRVGYHVRPGEHDLTLVDWNHFMDFAQLQWDE
jgi:pimeloyl-ACP methyl ester carboxylesterase